MSAFVSAAKTSLITKHCTKCRLNQRERTAKFLGRGLIERTARPPGWCFGCQQVLSVDDFYKAKSQPRGYSQLCRLCVKKRNKWVSPFWKKELKKTPEGRLKLHAWQVVSTAFKRGKLTRQPCEQCGENGADAHHDDYTKPLDIRWLCQRHHFDHHALRLHRPR